MKALVAFGVFLAILVALSIVTVQRCGDEERLPVRSPPLEPSGDLSLSHPGVHSVQVARQRTPEVRLVRTRTGYAGLVRGDPATEVGWLELKGEDGGPELRVDRRSADAPRTLTFELPHHYRGRLVARVHYASGETWRRQVDL